MCITFTFLKVVWKIIAGSGFEGIVYQADICTTSGSLNGIINGSHYNRCWHVHNILSEALERMLITRFIVESNKEIPDTLAEISHDLQKFSYSQMETCESFTQSYESYFQDVLNGTIGKTATFWAQYLKMMKFQRMIHLESSFTRKRFPTAFAIMGVLDTTVLCNRCLTTPGMDLTMWKC